jgi:RNA polymerase sigma factor (sigma-70 family)
VADQVPPLDPLAAAILGASALTLFENLYVAYAREGKRTGLAILRDAHLADDAVHTAFLEILRWLMAGHRWSDANEARAVVLRNVRWAALNVLRQRRRHPESRLAPIDAEADPADWARFEARALCESIVSQLRSSYQIALRHRYVDHLTSAEAAQLLGISVNAYEVRLSRALAAARRVARRMGIMQGIVVCCVVRLHRVRNWRPRGGHVHIARSGMSSRFVIASVSASVMFGVVAAYAGRLSVGVGHPSKAGVTVMLANQAVRWPADSPSIDDAVVVDAVAPAKSGAVFALGLAKQCHCWKVFHSTDGGTSWAAAPGPDQPWSGARIETGPGGPTSPEIFLLDTRSKVFAAGHFGTPFVTATNGPGGLTQAHSALCVRQAARTCGLLAGPPSSASEGAAGHVLALDDGRFLFFRPFGGVLCSSDGGVSWATRCHRAS